ncbi:gamma carbonic anhydrase family protein [Magnetospira thiophila]
MTPLILPFEDSAPQIADSAFIAPTACVLGDVTIGEDSSIWYGVTVRGDVNWIRIGARSNIQDNSMVHVTTAKWPTTIGDDVLVGHMAMIHGATLENGCFIGMKACIMDGAVVESRSMVAAGALVGPGKRIPAGELWAGIPARKVRDLTSTEMADFKRGTHHYVTLAHRHRAMLAEQ